jgi:hypothetical protein
MFCAHLPTVAAPGQPETTSAGPVLGICVGYPKSALSYQLSAVSLQQARQATGAARLGFAFLGRWQTHFSLDFDFLDG